MSLVVLRSWSDGQPPTVRGIAPDSDKDEVVVPDHKGRFVTTEVSKGPPAVPGGDKGQRSPPVPHPRTSVPPLLSVSSSPSLSPSPPVPELRIKTGQQWSNAAARSDKARTLPHDFRKMELKEPLSRESSVHSSGGSNDSPPSSPVCGSRYASLGPELAATIPRRQIIRETWIKESHSNFKKKEMSKSTPALNLISRDPEDSGAPTHLLCPAPRRNLHPHQDSRPLSYVDTFYGSDGEPKFGDRPASVVEVFKKYPYPAQQLSQSERNLVEIESKEPKCVNLDPKLAVKANVSKKLKAARSFSTEIQRVRSPAHRLIKERKDSLPLSLPSQNTAKVFRSELQLPLVSAAAYQFPVHKVVHTTSIPLEVEIEADEVVKGPSTGSHEHKSPARTLPPTPGEVRDENEEIDLELEALREESSRSTTSTAEVETLLADSPSDRALVSVQSETDMSTTCSSSTPSSPQFFFKDTRQRNAGGQMPNPKQIHGTNKVNESAWAQVPVQCVNRHVSRPQEHQHYQPPTEPKRMMNNGHSQNDYRTNQRRKNFCDDLLNDVIIQVPQNNNMRTRGPPSFSPPPQPQNHDGIIIFDEEEEDELNLGDSETESIGVSSEREKSVDYISIFHNVQVGSINEQSKSVGKTTTPDLVRVVGLDLGSVTTRYATLDKATGTVHIGPVRLSLTTSDGQRDGAESIPHAMATKSKLIYKWKAKQSFPFDPYDEEDCGTTLETLLRHYSHILTPPKRSKESKDAQENNGGTQWNLSIHGGMDKKLVREAALNSGFVKPMDELRLVNDSTAAAVTAFQFLQRQKPSHAWGKTFLSVNIGSTFIHTSGYELRGKKLTIIESSDSQFYESPESNLIELFSRLFGREFILKFESAFQPSWIEILTRFDEMKELFYKSHAECYLFLPISFYLEYHKFTGMEIAECLEDNIEEGIRWDRNGAIRFNKDLMTDWLQPIVNFVRTRLKIKTYDSLVLSGGGTNQFIANELSRLLPFVRVYNLPDPENAVVEGLVRLESANVTLSSPFSLGVGVMTPFDEINHPPEKCVTRQGKKWCSDVWDTLIRKGQPLTIGQAVVKRSYVGAQPGQNVLVLPIFKSEMEDPKLVTSPSVEKCCELRFEINKEKAWREVQLVIKCYESELTIVASGNDGEVNQVVIDF